MKRYILSALAGGALILGSAWAQSSTGPGSSAAEKQRYMQRQENQGDRIQQGVQSGKLTKQQGAALWRQNRRQQAMVRGMAKANGGNLTPRQERRISRSMNRQSRRIYRAKH